MSSTAFPEPARPAAISPGESAGPVLFIGGSGRSGSTLLERLLAEMDGVVVLGEVGHLWERGLQKNELCACGNSFRECEFWSSVGEKAFGGWQNVDPLHVLSLKDTVDRQRRMAQTGRRRTPEKLRIPLARYSEYYGRIYAAAREVTNAKVVIDSSKVAPTALALSHDRSIDLRVLHIVRDSRGVAYSWSKTVARPETHYTEDMPRLPAMTSTGLWLTHNLSIAALSHRGVPVHRLRYEDLVADPELIVRRAWEQLDLPGQGVLPMIDRHSIELHATHSVAGNPMRFRTGHTVLRPDNSWRESLSPHERRLVTLATYPVLRAYGYRLGESRK